MTRRFGRLAKSMLAIVFALVLAVGGLSIAVSATVVDEEFTVTTTQGIRVRTATNPNNNNNVVGALARNSVVRVDRREIANGFEWVRISHVITRANGSNGATNAQMVGRWMAVRNTSNGTLFANRTRVHTQQTQTQIQINSPSVSPAQGTPQTRFYFTAQTNISVPNGHRVYLSIVGQNWGAWEMNGSNNNRTWTQNLHPFPVGTHTARIRILNANGQQVASRDIGTFRVNAPPPPPAAGAAAGGAAIIANTWRAPTSNNRRTVGWRGNATGDGRIHLGHDYGAVRAGVAGDNIFAVANGTFVRHGNSEPNGRFVILRHTLPNNQIVYSFYAHLESVANSVRNMRRGDFVPIGHVIGTMGNTGTSASAVHLHFALVNRDRSSGSYMGSELTSRFSDDRATCRNGDIFFNPTYIFRHNRLPR